jgi:hypothetical protein
MDVPFFNVVVVINGNAFLHLELKMLVILRMNVRFVEFMRENYVRWWADISEDNNCNYKLQTLVLKITLRAANCHLVIVKNLNKKTTKGKPRLNT